MPPNVSAMELSPGGHIDLDAQVRQCRRQAIGLERPEDLKDDTAPSSGRI